MKLIESNTTIEQIGNVQEGNTFKMKSSRKAFQILSDLYSDKPLAIVRELGCNAMDSHVASGQPNRPFHIHLPNNLEPWLTIQDFGTGISHENIYNIYATYFESTKTNTDEQIGCLGLGSKSPFCYTDNFMVTSRVNGEERTYNAYFNEQNTPAIALMGTRSTNEDNGISIQIPIKIADFSIFSDAVKKAFRFFDVKPTISGGKIDWTLETPIFKGDDWASYEKFGYADCFAIMGGVTYRIDIGKLDIVHRAMAQKGGLVIKFKMGEIDFTPSRESLSYCDATIKALNNKFEYLKQDFAKRINDMLEQKENLFDAIKMIHTLQNKYAYVDGLVLKGKVMWKGIDVSHPIDLIRDIAKQNNTVIVNPYMTFHKSSWHRQKISESSIPSLDTNTLWYFDSGVKGVLTRVRNFCRDNDDKKITLFSKEAYDNLVSKGFPKEIFSSTDTLPKPTPKPRASRNGNVSVTQRTKGAYNVYEIGDINKITWDSVEVDPKTTSAKDLPKFYFVKDKHGFKFSFNVAKFNNRKIEDKGNLWRLMQFMGLQVQDVVMIAENNVKRLPKSCKNFVEWINDNLDLTYDPTGLRDTTEYSEGKFKEFTTNSKFSALSNTHPFKKFVNLVLKNHSLYNKFYHIRGMYNIDVHNIKPNTIDSKNEALKLIAKKIGTYSWSSDEIMVIVENLK